MEKANTLIVDALQELLIQASEAPIEADEAQTAIRYLNRMMARLDSQGISLGYTQISDLGDSITVPDGAVEGIIKNLAVMLAPQYDKQISQALVEGARAGLDAMRKLSISILPTSYADTLPMGSGNENGSILTSHFYPETAAQIANETGGYIAPESSTVIP